MGELDFDITKEIPSREVVDLSLLEPRLSYEEGFNRSVIALGCSGNLPKFFPRVPDVCNKLKRPNVAVNDEYREGQLTLPPELYDSRTYERNPILRGPMEEIVLAYEYERIRCGFRRNHLLGDGWSELFKERFQRTTPAIGQDELDDILEEKREEKLPESPRGKKIA